LAGLTVGTTIITRREAPDKPKLQVWDGSHRWNAIKKIRDGNKEEDAILIGRLKEVKVIVFK
jgi:hypothetical protein